MRYMLSEACLEVGDGLGLGLYHGRVLGQGHTFALSADVDGRVCAGVHLWVGVLACMNAFV